jgi:ribosomal protein S1
MILPGIVNNITNFCFVDIGVKESGLVHISQLRWVCERCTRLSNTPARSGKSD